MASTLINSTPSGYQRSTERAGLSARVVRAVAKGLEVLTSTTSRRAFIAELEARSDADLAALGINRNQITRHVHCDLFNA
ncbi:hypothetical protein [uncultured Roseovarius sp.]|uniref:hypothetical protein n=1 Tax=uncultured Roseovarius sp. TaxID=293344 RepID=UPI0026346A87|nr:hypothetical protein [uncultured Roseovarius sp.]